MGLTSGNLHVAPVHLPQLAFVLYNDQPPKSSESKDSSSRGHTKGEATLGAGGGFWFPHVSSSADS